MLKEIFTAAASAEKLIGELIASSKALKALDGVAAVSEENAAAAEEVSASTEEMNISIQKMSASAESLAEMARALQGLVGSFKV